MNRDEAKNILLLYRTDADAADPQVAAALSFMKNDPELRDWFQDYSAQQQILREKFRQIAAPTGLKEQILSEAKAMAGKNSRREKMVAIFAVAAIVAALVVVAVVYFPRHPATVADNTVANFEGQMLGFAQVGYAMNLATNDLTQIQAYLAQKHSPSGYTLPAGLVKTPATGCTVQYFQGTKVSMICFVTGKPLKPNQPGDLWLFVAQAGAVMDAPSTATPQLADVNGVSVATWTQDGKFYLLATPGDQQAVQKYL